MSRSPAVPSSWVRIGLAVFAGLAIGTTARAQAPAVDETTMIVAPGATITLHPETPTHSVEATLDGGLVVPLRGALRAPDSGTHWLSVLSRDAAGNASDLRWIRLVVDDEAPEIELSFSQPPATDIHETQWLRAGTTVTARAVDRLSGIDGVSIEADGGPEGVALDAAGEIEAAVLLSEEGTYEIRAEAIDAVENRSEPVVATYSVDGVGPVGEVFAEGPHVQTDGLLVVGPATEIHVKMNDAKSGIVHWSAELDGEAREKDDFHRGWSPGRHEAGAQMMDLVGNHAELTPTPFFFDDQGPEVTWEIENQVLRGCEGRPVAVPPVSLSFAATDSPAGVSTFQISTDGTGWTESDGRAVLDGDRLQLRATDAVGNTSVVHASWDLDTEPPSLQLVAPDGVAHEPGSSFVAENGDVLRIEVADDSCSVPDVRYRVEDGRSVAARGRTIPMLRKHCFIRPLADRYCRVTVEATDPFGRRTSAVWKVDVKRSDSGGDT